MAVSMSNSRIAVLFLILLALNMISGVAHAQPAQWTVETLKLPSPAVRLFLKPGRSKLSRIRIMTRRDGWFALKKCDEKPCLKALKSGYKRTAPPRDALPDTEVTFGKRNIRAIGPAFKIIK
jgi:hypothetical protein